MKNKKLFPMILLILIVLSLTASCTGLQAPQNQYNQTRSKDYLNEEEVVKAIADVIKEKGIRGLMPSAPVVIAVMFVPISAIVGFFIFISIAVKQHNKKVLSMIEKGTYTPNPIKIRWDLIIIFTGVILLFLGPAISVTAAAVIEVQAWTVLSGLIPFMLGAALIVIYYIYKKIK